jgi:hypothetical protein
VGVASVIVAGVALRLLGLDKGIWLDEFDSIDIAQSQDLLVRVTSGHTPPLYYWLLRFWNDAGAALGVSVGEAWARGLSVGIDAATLIVLAAWLWRIQPRASWIGVMLFATLPIALGYGSEIRCYGLLMLGTAASFWAAELLKSRPDSASGAIALSLALCLCVSTHAVGIFVLPSTALYLVWTLPNWRSRVRTLVPVYLLPLGCFGYTFFVIMAEAMATKEVWIPRPGLMHTARQFVVFTAGPLRALMLMAAFGLVLVFARSWERPQLRSPAVALLAAAIVYWLQLLAYSWVALPIFLDRTALPGLPIFLGGLSLAAVQIKGDRQRAIALAALVACCSVFACIWIARDAYVPREHWREMVAFQREHEAPDDVIAVYPQWSIGPLVYYRPELERSGWFIMQADADPAKEHFALEEHWVGGRARNPDSSLWIFLREDLDTQETALRIVERLRAQHGPAVLQERYANLLLFRFDPK